ncbi:MAG TPA: rhomboid family intramembrane serine protease [Kiritimatiellia bacterium]|nr:rhomboid family intramembrane serine protease [Kiritimatiellia bacterium]
MYITNGMFRYGHLSRTVRILIWVFTGIFLVQFVMPSSVELLILHIFGLSVTGIMQGWWWQFLTYAFLHGGFLHLILNMIGLYFLGPELERHMGPRAFLAMLIFCAILGGIGWFALRYPYEGVCVGASAGIFGLIGAFAGLFPRRELTLLIFFVLPVTMPAWLLAVLFGLLQLAYLFEPSSSGIAYSAHLAGGIAGFIYVRVLYRGYEGRYTGLDFIPKKSRETGPSKDEIDMILDKVSMQGIHSLSARERAILQKASRR